MGASETSNWILDYPLIDEIPISTGENGFYWQNQGFDASSGGSVEVNGLVETNGLSGSNTQKRPRQESTSVPGSKACREKMRRDRLNDKFVELVTILEPGKPPRTDKAAILSDALRMVTQLRDESQKLKDSNESLHEKIRELKSEKNELRDEKQRLKAEKESLEQQLKALSMPPSFLPHPAMLPNPFMSPAHAAGGKLMMPYMGFPGFVYPFHSPANVDDKNELPPAA